MATALFELGEHTVDGPAFDMQAAGDFYLPMRDKVEALGLGDLSLRLGRMAEIDARIVEDARQNGTVPIFLTPDAYPIEGETSAALRLVAAVRRLITNPSKRDLKFGSVTNEVDTQEDKDVIAQIDEVETMLVHPDYHPLAFMEPDNRTLHWYMPTVIDEIAVMKEEVLFDANEGFYDHNDGRPIPKPFKYTRKIGLMAYRTGKERV